MTEHLIVQESTGQPMMRFTAENLFEFYGSDGVRLVTVTADGTTTVHDRVRTDEAASIFWDAIIRMGARLGQPC